MSEPMKAPADRGLAQGAAEAAGCGQTWGSRLIAPKSSHGDEGFHGGEGLYFVGAIDKLDLRLPRVTTLRPSVAAFIKDSEDVEDSSRRQQSRYYSFVCDLRPIEIDARLHLGLKRAEDDDHANEGKLELIDAGTKGLSELRAVIESVVDCPPDDLGIMRIDLCADIVGVPVQWFFDKTRVRFKRLAREIGELKSDRIGKLGIQTLTAGMRPNVVRIYDKAAEYREQLRKELRRAKGACELTLESRFGVSEDAIITRIERQFGGGSVPTIVRYEGEQRITTRIESFGELTRLPRSNPFSNLEIVNGTGAGMPAVEDCELGYWLKGTRLRQLLEEMGLQQFCRWLNRSSAGNAARIRKEYAAFLELGEPVITAETVSEIYRQSVKEQLAR